MASTQCDRTGRDVVSCLGVAWRALALAGVFVAVSAAADAQLTVVSTSPTLNKTNVDRTSAIVVNFDRAVDPSTFTLANFYPFARWSGPVQGGLAFGNGNKTVTLTPSKPFLAGESVMLVMSHNLKAADGTFLRSAGYTLTFTAGAVASPGMFCHRSTFTSKDASGAFTRIYGGLACDLNLDGAPDLTLINEVSADLRVFLNLNDGSGTFGNLLLPPTPIPVESSPNRACDFNKDGFVDVVTSSNATDEISIAMGNGDGTFDPPTIIPVGDYPRGFGILDFDGDGDMDITVACAQSNQIALLSNNGLGVFAPPLFMATDENGPYGMTAADMDNDAILDLVVGFNFSKTCGIYKGNGNGTFTKVSSRDLGGLNWVIAAGDINGDGNMDVSCANSGSSNGSILFGNGNGTLQPVIVVPNGGHTTGTDLADFDGDGDLDWVIASYGAKKWYVYKYNGGTSFTLSESFDAVGNPACTVSADYDNDGRVDLVLLDETMDLVNVMGNAPLGACYANCDCSPALDINDFICFQTNFALGLGDADCDEDGSLSIDDFICFQTLFAIGC